VTTQSAAKDDDLLYGQGSNDNMQGNDGDDYMEGNAGADEMQGNDGNDDMAGGTGRIFQGNLQDPPEGRDGRLDSGETGMSGGNGFDFMIGDNGVITRKVDSGGAWMPNTFHICDPLSDCNGVQHNPVVLRDVQLLGAPAGAGTSGGEQNMAGDDQDDIMYGQGGGDEMFGGNGEDYMEGNHDGDNMYGNAGEDDMLGGGSDDSNIADTSEPDLTATTSCARERLHGRHGRW
jgi:Ca2+-binding RTX toxin-like protein